MLLSTIYRVVGYGGLQQTFVDYIEIALLMPGSAWVGRNTGRAGIWKKSRKCIAVTRTHTAVFFPPPCQHPSVKPFLIEGANSVLSTSSLLLFQLATVGLDQSWERKKRCAIISCFLCAICGRLGWSCRVPIPFALPLSLFHIDANFAN